ncbi:unnamed protein product, partial [Phaeothamnion confervicola]
MPSFASPSGPQRAERIGSNLYRVSIGEFRSDDPIQRENYTLLRAAETAQGEGGTHFVIVNLGDQAGGSGPASRTSGQTLVRVLSLEPGIEPPVGAVSATEIIQFFGP